MASSFFGIGIGTQALYTAKTALNITSHNIANAETVGYSRQYGLQSATRPLTNVSSGMIGTGSEITNILQYRDAYLDNKYWSMSNEMGEYEIKEGLLSQMELIFNEPSDTGYSTFFDNIFESLQTLSTDAQDSSSKIAFVDSLESFASIMNDMGEQLIDIQKEANFGIKTAIDEINVYADELASLNGQIATLELTGNMANDLRDERNRVIDELSKIINVDIDETADANGKSNYRVSINGQTLVDNTTANGLEVQTRATSNNPEDYVDMYDVYWESGKELYLNNNNISGELKGYIDIRDGNNGENFTGTVLSGEGTGTVVISNPSRTDLPTSGELNLDGTLILYNEYTYDSLTDQITFNVGVPASVDGNEAVATDINGSAFTGTITWDSSTQVRLANPGGSELPSTGTVVLDGVSVTYTGYAIDAGTNEITLTIEAPAAIDGTDTFIGDDMSFKGVPYYLQQLNEFVRTLAKEFNTVNESGNGDTGTQLFTFEGYTGTPALDINDEATYNQITIHNFVVNEAVIDDSSLVETSATADGGESANDLILDLIEMRHDTDMFAKGKPDSFMQSLMGEVGIDARQNTSFKDGQESLLLLIDNQRQSVSGVDVTEETTNLIKFQQAYNVAAKIISVMDEIYNTTINVMGV